MKIRPIPFVPTVAEITAAEAGGIRGLGAVISHWTEGAYDEDAAGAWFDEVTSSWGPAGLFVRRGDGVSGFAVYGPQRCLPRAGRYPVGPLDEETPLLAYLEGDDARTRRHLLVRCVRDLKLRGFGGVEAVASDAGLPRHVPTGFLAGSGWRPVRRASHAGFPYTLMRADFGSLVEVGELARGLVGKVRLPRLKSPMPETPTSALLPLAARARTLKVRERRS